MIGTQNKPRLGTLNLTQEKTKEQKNYVLNASAGLESEVININKQTITYKRFKRQEAIVDAGRCCVLSL